MAKSTLKRDKQTRKEEQRRRQQEAALVRERRRKRDRLFKVGGGILALVVLAVAVFVAQRGASTTAASGPVSSALGPPSSAPSASLTNTYKATASVLRFHQKPEVLFVSALYCPFCASERWALVKALSWFGTWSNLRSSISHAGSGGFSAVPTFELLGAHYRSHYVTFASKDIEDENSQPLQTLTPSQQTLFNRYDPTGGIPMVLVANHVMLGAAYQPSELMGHSFGAVQSALQRNGSQQYVQDINGEANRIAAILCRTDGMQPVAVCNRPAVRTWEGQV